MSQGLDTSGARMELAMAAASRERANRPRGLVILACVLAAGAMVYTIYGLGQLGAAKLSVDREAQSTARVISMVAQVKQESTGAAEAKYAPNPHVASQLEALAGNVGLSISQVTTSDNPVSAPSSSLIQRRFSARAQNADPATIFAFLQAARDEANFPGLEIYNLYLTPGSATPVPDPRNLQDSQHAGGWNLSVDFTRWERRS